MTWLTLPSGDMVNLDRIDSLIVGPADGDPGSTGPWTVYAVRLDSDTAPAPLVAFENETHARNWLRSAMEAVLG